MSFFLKLVYVEIIFLIDERESSFPNNIFYMDQTVFSHTFSVIYQINYRH